MDAISDMGCGDPIRFRLHVRGDARVVPSVAAAEYAVRQAMERSAGGGVEVLSLGCEAVRDGYTAYLAASCGGESLARGMREAIVEIMGYGAVASWEEG